MKKEDETKKELEGLSPFLAKIKSGQEDPFVVPKDYFKSLEDQLISEIPKNERITTPEVFPKVSWLDWFAQLILPKPQLALGFGVLVILIVGTVFWVNQDKGLTSTSLANAETAAPIDYEEIEQYVVDHIDEFGTDLLIEVLEADQESLLPNEEFESDEVEALFEELLDEVDLPDLESVL